MKLHFLLVLAAAAGVGGIAVAQDSPTGRARPPVPQIAGAGLIDDDYPAEAFRAGQQGVVGVVLTVDAKGRVTNCSVASSSGSASLDAGACRILSRIMKFRPALDAEGKKTASTFATKWTWKLPEAAGLPAK